MTRKLHTLKRPTEAEKRDFNQLTISDKAPLYDTALPTPDGTRRPFSGTPDEIAIDIRTFAAIGVHELIFDFRSETLPASLQRMERFAETAMPRVETTEN